MNAQKRNKLKRRRAKRRVLLPTKSNMAALLMDAQIKTKIPDRQERQEYIDGMIEALVITCDNCEFRAGCDENYQDCQYNPANEVD